MSTVRIPFIDLRGGEDEDDVRTAIARVIHGGRFVLGPEVEAFEREFAAASGVGAAVGVGNGTDALALILRALGIGVGDEVIVPGLTAAYTGLAALMVGARPVFADVEADRLTLDPDACAALITARTAVIVPVHLYGQPADLERLVAVAARHGLPVVEDCCQAHLATCNGRPVGTFGVAGAFSFYPTKNLGALGDAGAVVTGDAALAERVRRLRHGGQIDRYRHVDAGVNSRLDELQAAVLRARLPYLRAWTERRRTLAAQYSAMLAGTSAMPVAQHERGHVYHLFPVRSVHRDALQTHLRRAGIETLVHYPMPLPEQEAFGACAPADCPRSTRAAGELLSLPLHPRLTDENVRAVAETVCEFEKGRSVA